MIILVKKLIGSVVLAMLCNCAWAGVVTPANAEEVTLMAGAAEISLTEKELIGLYILMRNSEMNLDAHLSALLLRVEKILYRRLTIEDIEKIDEVYKKI